MIDVIKHIVIYISDNSTVLYRIIKDYVLRDLKGKIIIKIEEDSQTTRSGKSQIIPSNQLNRPFERVKDVSNETINMMSNVTIGLLPSDFHRLKNIVIQVRVTVMMKIWLDVGYDGTRKNLPILVNTDSWVLTQLVVKDRMMTDYIDHDTTTGT